MFKDKMKRFMVLVRFAMELPATIYKRLYEGKKLLSDHSLPLIFDRK